MGVWLGRQFIKTFGQIPVAVPRSNSLYFKKLQPERVGFRSRLLCTATSSGDRPYPCLRFNEAGALAFEPIPNYIFYPDDRNKDSSGNCADHPRVSDVFMRCSSDEIAFLLGVSGIVGRWETVRDEAKYRERNRWQLVWVGSGPGSKSGRVENFIFNSTMTKSSLSSLFLDTTKKDIGSLSKLLYVVLMIIREVVIVNYHPSMQDSVCPPRFFCRGAIPGPGAPLMLA